jgi:hypothetical protein
MANLANRPKFGRIEVVQDRNQFLVRIHPKDRDRAKRIAGRQWDGERQAWVYPRDLVTYGALVEEFQEDADRFDISPPRSKIPPPQLQLPNNVVAPDLSGQAAGPPVDSAQDLEDAESAWSEDLPVVELAEIFSMLGSISALAQTHSQDLQELREQQTGMARILEETRLPSKVAAKAEIVRALPEFLDLVKQKERGLFENALVGVACDASRKSVSFRQWIVLHPPIDDPGKFVIATHEKLKERLEEIVGEGGPGDSFSDLVERVDRDNIIYSGPHDPTKVCPILRNLNSIRNRFTHPRGIFDPSERWARSIVYLMNLALVWRKIMPETEDGHG